MIHRLNRRRAHDNFLHGEEKFVNNFTWMKGIDNIYNTVYCMQYFIAVFVYCILRAQFLASTPTGRVGEGAGSQTDIEHTRTIHVNVYNFLFFRFPLLSQPSISQYDLRWVNASSQNLFIHKI